MNGLGSVEEGKVLNEGSTENKGYIKTDRMVITSVSKIM
jgi:hypothetical protein